MDTNVNQLSDRFPAHTETDFLHDDGDTDMGADFLEKGLPVRIRDGPQARDDVGHCACGVAVARCQSAAMGLALVTVMPTLASAITSSFSSIAGHISSGT